MQCKNLHKTSSLKSFNSSIVIMKPRMPSNPMMIEHYRRISNWSIWFIRFWNHMLMPHLIYVQNLDWTGTVRDYYYSLHKRTYATKIDREKWECFNRDKTGEYDNMKRKRINRPYAILASNWLVLHWKYYISIRTPYEIRQS